MPQAVSYIDDITSDHIEGRPATRSVYPNISSLSATADTLIIRSHDSGEISITIDKPLIIMQSNKRYVVGRQGKVEELLAVFLRPAPEMTFYVHIERTGRQIFVAVNEHPVAQDCLTSQSLQFQY